MSGGPQYPNLYRHLKQRLGHSLRASLYQRSVVRKKATHKCSRVEGGFSGPSKVQGPMSKPNSVGCYGQLDSSSLHKQGGTHLAEMCALLWKIMTGCHLYQITPNSQAHSGYLNLMADLSRSREVQSTKWSLHLQVFKQIFQKWFTPRVDLFASRPNHKVPLYVSLVPDPHTWDIDALNINWSGQKNSPHTIARNQSDCSI